MSDDGTDAKVGKKYVYYNLRLSPPLADRLERAIAELNASAKKKYSKQNLIHSAIIEQLEREMKNIQDGGQVKKLKQVRLKIDRRVSTLLDEHLQGLKQSKQNPGSKNLWINSAIDEKLSSPNE